LKRHDGTKEFIIVRRVRSLERKPQLWYRPTRACEKRLNLTALNVKHVRVETTNIDCDRCNAKSRVLAAWIRRRHWDWVTPGVTADSVRAYITGRLCHKPTINLKHIGQLRKRAKVSRCLALNYVLNCQLIRLD